MRATCVLLVFGMALVAIAFGKNHTANISSSLGPFNAADKTPIDWYDCTGKSNGNYPHPVDCTRFVTCSNEIASERDCAVCETDPIRCPEGRLIFDVVSNRCLYANEAKCHSLCDELRVGGKLGKVRGGRRF